MLTKSIFSPILWKIYHLQKQIISLVWRKFPATTCFLDETKNAPCQRPWKPSSVNIKIFNKKLIGSLHSFLNVQQIKNHFDPGILLLIIIYRLQQISHLSNQWLFTSRQIYWWFRRLFYVKTKKEIEESSSLD